MKKILLILTLLTSVFSFSQDYMTTLRFGKSTKFDELIHTFDNPSSEVGYFEFYLKNDKPTELHFHGKDNTECKTYTITDVVFDAKEGDMVYDKYTGKDNKTNDISFIYIYMNESYNRFNIMVSNKDNRGTIYLCNTLEVNDYLGPSKFKKLENWFINKSIYELKL